MLYTFSASVRIVPAAGASILFRLFQRAHYKFRLWVFISLAVFSNCFSFITDVNMLLTCFSISACMCLRKVKTIITATSGLLRQLRKPRPNLIESHEHYILTLVYLVLLLSASMIWTNAYTRHVELTAKNNCSERVMNVRCVTSLNHIVIVQGRRCHKRFVSRFEPISPPVAIWCSCLWILSFVRLWRLIKMFMGRRFSRRIKMGQKWVAITHSFIWTCAFS